MNFLQFFCFVALAIYPSYSASNYVQPPTKFVMELIGTAGTKSFFAEAMPPRTWLEALTFCPTIGMALATINTPAELAALRNTTSPNFPANEYWIGARDSRTLSQFRWHLTMEPIPPFLELRFTTFQSALTFFSSGPTESYLISRQIGQRWGTLCELNHTPPPQPPRELP